MSLSNAAETALLNLLFDNQAWANIGNAGGLPPSTADGSFYIALHTADPDEAGNQQTSEVSTGAYAGYARVAVSRATGFSITGNEVTNVADIVFPLCTGGTGGAGSLVGWFSVGTLVTGTGMIIVSGALSSTLQVTNGVQPIIPATELDVTAN